MRRLATLLAWPTACAMLLSLALWWAGEALVRRALPWVPAAMASLVPALRVESMHLARAQGERMVQVQVRLVQPLALGGQVLMPHPHARAQASTLALAALNGPWLAAWALLVAGPGGARGRAVALLLWCPLAALLVVGDLALTLSAALWGLLLDGLAPGSSSVLLGVQQLWAGGGRWAVSLGLAWCVGTLLHQWRWRSRPSSKAPPASSRATLPGSGTGAV